MLARGGIVVVVRGRIAAERVLDLEVESNYFKPPPTCRLQATLLLLDEHDTFLCPAEHLPYLAARCAKATVRWRAGWHCGWMYGRLYLEAGRDMGRAIDEFVGTCGEWS